MGEEFEMQEEENNVIIKLKKNKNKGCNHHKGWWSSGHCSCSNVVWEVEVPSSNPAMKSALEKTPQPQLNAH